MMRWLREFRQPALKCARTSHIIGVEMRSGTRKPTGDEWRYFACVEATQERFICVRCKAALDDWHETKSKGFTACSWPETMAKKFDEDGVIWERHWVSREPEDMNALVKFATIVREKQNAVR